MLSNRVKNLKPSPTLALATKAKELRAQGKDVISLSVGEPDWDTFESIKKAGLIAIENGDTKYTPSNGIPDLRKAIAKVTSSETGLEFEADEVTVSTGGKFVIFAAMQALLNPADEVLIPSPYWVSYPTQVELAEGKPKIITTKKENNFKLAPDELEKAIGKNSKLLILNSPSNPTGGMYTKEELTELSKVIAKHKDLMVLSDDIYNKLVFNPEGLAPHLLQVAPKLRDRVLIVNGVSKSYSLTGWRLGWALGPKEVIVAMTRYQSQSVSCVPGFVQKAALQAIEGGEAELKNAVAKLKRRRDFAFELFKGLSHVDVECPDGAFYIWPDFGYFIGKSWKEKKIKNSRDLAGGLLEDQMVAAVPGIEFGAEGYLRISYALSEDKMTEAVSRIRAFLSELK